MGLVSAIVAGSRLLAEDLLPWSNQINSVTAPGWTTYAGLTITAPTTNPTKGNSTYTGRYRRHDGGDVIDYEVYILIGSTFSAGSGLYRFSVPVNASAASTLGAVGNGYIFDNGTANRPVAVTFETASQLNLFLPSSTTGIASGGSGTAWANGDIIKFSIRYEPA